MDAATLVSGKGRQVEINSNGKTVVGTLMGQQRNKYVVSFYVRIDGSKCLIPARRIIRFV